MVDLNYSPKHSKILVRECVNILKFIDDYTGKRFNVGDKLLKALQKLDKDISNKSMFDDIFYDEKGEFIGLPLKDLKILLI